MAESVRRKVVMACAFDVQGEVATLNDARRIASRTMWVVARMAERLLEMNLLDEADLEEILREVRGAGD